MNQKHNEPIQQVKMMPENLDDEIDILSMLQTFGEKKWLLLGIPLFCSCVAAIVSLNLAPIYTAKATFFVPDKQSSSSLSANLEQLSGLGLGGIAGILSKNNTDTFVAFMQSNTVQDEIISELGLTQRYKTRNQEDTRKKLLSLVKISTDKKSGLLVIEAQDPSPEFSAKLANAYLKPFRAFLNRMSLEEANLKRDFFAQQVIAVGQRPFRDAFVQSTLMSSMIKQYETARIEAAKESHVLIPIDVASIPETRSWPNRTMIVLVVGSATLFMTILWLLTISKLGNMQTDSVASKKWTLVKIAWKLRSNS